MMTNDKENKQNYSGRSQSGLLMHVIDEFRGSTIGADLHNAYYYPFKVDDVVARQVFLLILTYSGTSSKCSTGVFFQVR